MTSQFHAFCKMSNSFQSVEFQASERSKPECDAALSVMRLPSYKTRPLL